MKKIALMLLSIMFTGILSAGAQSQTITGHITFSENQEPAAGVAVSVPGTITGTISNSEGYYTITVPDDINHLVYSFVGMKNLRKEIKGSTVDVQLEPDYVGIDEVVVLGYQQKGRNELTGSASQVDGDQIASIPVVSVEQSLQGKVPGLMVATTSGTPGSEQQLLIRGMGSITAGNQPLIVIDGVPVVNENLTVYQNHSSFGPLASLNTSDIESITILKDASATAAYGSRGSNGVVVITTRRGKTGEVKFNLNAATGFQNDAVDGIIPLTAQQRAELMLESVYNSFSGKNELAKNNPAAYLRDSLGVKQLENWDGSHNDWNSLIRNENALYHDYDISASGGGETSTFYISLGYTSAEATVHGGDFERYSSKFNFNRDLSEKVRFSANIIVSNTVQDLFLEQGLLFANPHLGRYLMNPLAEPFQSDGTTLNTAPGTYVFNLLYLLENDFAKNDVTRGMGNMHIDWMITNRLKFRSLVSGDYFVNAYHDYRNRVHGDYARLGGYANQSVSRNFNRVMQNSFDYINNYNDHNFSVKALMEYQVNRYNILAGSGQKFPADDLHYIASAGANNQATSSFTDWKNISYLGMLNYSYQQKYIADFTYRYEGSSRFAPGRRFADFWSAGAAWNIGQEDFLADVGMLDILRLRASYGLSGNSQIGINRYQPLFSFDANYAGEGAFYPGQYENADLTWEKNKTLDVGVEFSVFNGRLSGTFNWYNKKTFDLLQDVPLSPTTGHSLKLMNVGEMVNRGIEALLAADIVRSKEFNISVSANFATLHNEVTELAADSEGNEIVIETDTRKVAVGHPIFGWYMRKWAGVDPQTGNALWYLNDQTSETTTDYYDPKIRKVWMDGNPLPTYTGGFSLHADYKGIFVDGTLYFAGGNKIYDENASVMMHSGFNSLMYFNGMTELMNRWQNPGDVTDVPKVVWSSTNRDSSPSSRFLYDGDYVRLKDIVLGYHLPDSWAEGIGMENITLSVRGANLITWVKDDRLKQDPEVRFDGSVRQTVPPVKSVVFGVNLKF